MPFKIEIQTNIEEQDLTIESCSRIIDMLQDTYKNIRKELYSHFLGTAHLMRALLFVFVLAFFYIFTREVIFIYLMPFFVFVAFCFAVASAEFLTTRVRKQIKEQIAELKLRKEALLRKQKMNY